MTTFQIIFVPFFGCVALIILLQAIRGQMSRRLGVSWAFLWLLGGGVIAFPGSAIIAAGWLGIGRGADLMFYVAVIGGLLGFVYFHRCFRAVEMRVTELVRLRAIEKAEKGNYKLAVNDIDGEKRDQATR